MAQAVVGLSDKNGAQVVAFATTVHTSMTGNPNVPVANPPLATIQLKITAASNAINDYDLTKALLATKKEIRDEAIADLKLALIEEAATVQLATGGDAAKILSTGYKVKAHPTPVAVPGQVMNLVVKPSDHEGALDASWKAERSSIYEIQSSPDPITSWTPKGTSTKAKATVNSFTSGDRIWLKVRAVGPGGAGAWSEQVLKTVP